MGGHDEKLGVWFLFQYGFACSFFVTGDWVEGMSRVHSPERGVLWILLVLGFHLFGAIEVSAYVEAE